MKSASNTLTETPLNDVTAGIDWARDDHAVCVVDARGRQVARSTVEHTAAGLRELVGFLAKNRVGEVAIERPDGPVIDALLEAGLTVVVISPNQVKNLRGRYGSAGNKDDRFDAFVLADTLRTDRPRLRRLEPDTASTIALRRTCRARKDLVSHRVAAANQLRAHLRNVLPGAVGLFADIDSEIALAFLTRFTTQAQADWLTPTRLRDWLAKTGYSGRTSPAVLHTRLTAAPRGLTGPEADNEAGITRALLAVLATLVEQIKTLSAQISAQLDTHADQHIFTSLPRAGRVRAARLLAEIGDCRASSPPPNPWPAWPASHPRPDSPASSAPSVSAGPATNNSATLSPTSLATADTPTPGPQTSTNAPVTEAMTTPTPCASSPAPGCSSSGTAGNKAPPTTPPNTTHSNGYSPPKPKRLDTGLLIPASAGQAPEGRWSSSVPGIPPVSSTSRLGWSRIMSVSSRSRSRTSPSSDTVGVRARSLRRSATICARISSTPSRRPCQRCPIRSRTQPSATGDIQVPARAAGLDRRRIATCSRSTTPGSWAPRTSCVMTAKAGLHGR